MQGIKTKSEEHIIFDITDPSFCSGKMIPSDFDTSTGEWFFQPTAWEPPAWGFNFIYLGKRGFPMAYSPGYPTLEAALAAAETWEIERKKQDVINKASMSEIFNISL